MKCVDVTFLRADKILAMPTLHCLKSKCSTSSVPSTTTRWTTSAKNIRSSNNGHEKILERNKKAKTLLQKSEPEGPTLLQKLQSEPCNARNGFRFIR